MPVKKQALKQIRLYCVHSCMNNQTNEVLFCPSIKCPFYDMRFGKNKTNPRKRASKQIRLYCTDCSDGKGKVKKCTFIDCELFELRCKARKLCKIDSDVEKCNNTNDLKSQK